jgi:hypothetical protein
MAQATTTNANTGNTNTNTTNGNSSTEGNGKGKRDPKPPTAIEAAAKIGKILEQLTPTDRKRVLAFVNESDERSE